MVKHNSLNAIKIVFFDFDGVFTNNQVLVSQDGTESVLCNRSDGLGLNLLRSLDIRMLILSTEINPVVKMRANKLKLDCMQGLEDKLTAMKKILAREKISPQHAAYVGNDINDIDCMQYVGTPVAVNDAYPKVKKIANIILKKNGGYGAVREFCEMIYSAQKV